MAHRGPHAPPERRPELPELPNKTLILCPRKRHRIGTLNTGIGHGELLGFNKVNFESGQSRLAGEPMSCRICGSVYFVQNRLYTENGWFPDDPQLEPVPYKRK